MHFEGKNSVCTAPLCLRRFTCSNDGATVKLNVSQSSGEKPGEPREREVLSSTQSELVVSLHETLLADVNQGVTRTECERGSIFIPFSYTAAVINRSDNLKILLVSFPLLPARSSSVAGSSYSLRLKEVTM